MWDLRIAPPYGKFSIRNILMFVATMLVTIFSYIVISAPTTYAVDADWRGSAIVYEGNQYTKMADAVANDKTGLPEGSQLYSYVDTSTEPRKAYFIYFPQGIDVATATTASLAEFNYTPPATYQRVGEQTITLTEQNASNQSVNSCDSSFTFGIGWIVCPVTNFLAGAMDWLFEILTGFLAVRPAQTNQENALYRAWSFMRGFANVAFVIAFLIIIYSQITSLGISNYGIKKMLPRLIVAAILVNISYWICSIAIDVSNIMGYSIQNIFISMRNSIIGGEGNSWDVVSWSSIGGFILSGGTAAAAAGIGTVAAIAGAGGAIYLLVPLLLGALVAVLIALLVMAARQAIITVLVIIAPLAFVAYLLPNTEKYFDKWRGLFMTMLLVFPMFSVVFGGAQLAGVAIIQNADSINLILLGMAVQVAPVAITPLLIKFGGGILNRFAGIVNNPAKGFVDRSKKWADSRSEQQRDRVLAKPNARGLSRVSQNINNKRRRRDDWHKTNQARADNNYRSAADYGLIDEANREADRTKRIIDQQFDQTWNVKARIDPNSLDQELKLRVTADEASLAKTRLDSVYEEIKSDNREHANRVFGTVSEGRQNSAINEDRVAMLNRASDTATFLATEGMRRKAAEGEQKSRLAKDLLQNTKRIDGKSLQDYAGGIDEHGANSALAEAVSIDRRQYAERVSEADAILKHFNISGADRQAHAMGKRDITLTDTAGNTKVLTNDSTFTREAAIEAQLGGAGNMENIEEIIINSGGKLSEFKTTIAQGIVKNQIANKAPYWGGKSIDEVTLGKINGEQDMNAVATRAIAQGKIKPAQLATMDQVAIQNILKVINEPNTSRISDAEAQELTTRIKQLRKDAVEALTSDSLKGTIAANVRPTLEIIAGNYYVKGSPDATNQSDSDN